MSFFHSINHHTITPVMSQMTSYSKLDKTTKDVKGFLVEDFQFVTVDITKDERQGLRYQYYSLCNLKALGVDGQLKMCVVPADNFKIADSYEELLIHSQEVPAENNKA